MKILFTADWHIKLGQKNVPVDWAKNRYNMFFGMVHALEETHDMHVIGGDLFDRLPTMEELELYFKFVSKCTIPTIIYDGNHEATKKGKTFFDSLKEATQAINSKVQVITETYYVAEPGFHILPYADLHKKGMLDNLRNMSPKKPLFTHVRGEIPPHVKPEIDLDLLADFPVVFAGQTSTLRETMETCTSQSLEH